MKSLRVRKLDAAAVWEAERKRRIREIEDEKRRRSKITAEIGTPKYRQLGEQDITDIPTNTPWQYIALNQLGEVHRVNADWVCPRCGLKTIGSFPPDVCPVCKCISPISRLNLRR